MPRHGVDNADKSWVSGMWWGRTARAGEGFVLDRAPDGTTFFAWYTHRPALGRGGLEHSR
jgi:hypothetical protein